MTTVLETSTTNNIINTYIFKYFIIVNYIDRNTAKLANGNENDDSTRATDANDVRVNYRRGDGFTSFWRPMRDRRPSLVAREGGV